MTNNELPRLLLTDLKLVANSEWDFEGDRMHRFFVLEGPDAELDRARRFYAEVGARVPLRLDAESGCSRRLYVKLSKKAVIYTGPRTGSRPIDPALVPAKSEVDVVLAAYRRDMPTIGRVRMAVCLDLALVTMPTWAALLEDRGVSDVVRVSGALPVETCE